MARDDRYDEFNESTAHLYLKVNPLVAELARPFTNVDIGSTATSRARRRRDATPALFHH